jgi:hypothetical protein
MADEKTQTFNLQVVDVPELSETFADSVGSCLCDGQTARLELCVTRFDHVKPQTQLSGKRYPICRLVLTLPALADLANKAQGLMQALAKQGAAVQQKPPTAPS